MSLEAGVIVEGRVTKITEYGAFIHFPEANETGLVHISEIAHGFVKDVKQHLTEDEVVKVKVLGRDEKGRLDLSIKELLDPPAALPRRTGRQSAEFESKLRNFMRDAKERMTGSKSDRKKRKR